VRVLTDGRFFEVQGPKCREVLNRPPPKQSNARLLKKKKLRRRICTCTREVEDPPTSLSHFHCGNSTEAANEPLDSASEQDHMGPLGQYLTSLDSPRSVGASDWALGYYKLGLL